MGPNISIFSHAFHSDSVTVSKKLDSKNHNQGCRLLNGQGMRGGSPGGLVRWIHSPNAGPSPPEAWVPLQNLHKPLPYCCWLVSAVQMGRWRLLVLCISKWHQEDFPGGQWMGTHLLVQGARAQSLVRVDSTYRKATKCAKTTEPAL